MEVIDIQETTTTTKTKKIPSMTPRKRHELESTKTAGKRSKVSPSTTVGQTKSVKSSTRPVKETKEKLKSKTGASESKKFTAPRMSKQKTSSPIDTETETTSASSSQFEGFDFKQPALAEESEISLGTLPGEIKAESTYTKKKRDTIEEEPTGGKIRKGRSHSIRGAEPQPKKPSGKRAKPIEPEEEDHSFSVEASSKPLQEFAVPESKKKAKKKVDIPVLYESDIGSTPTTFGDDSVSFDAESSEEIGRAVQQECRDRSRMPSSA
eukprot:TRINITY_DN34563_c0_g1_i2.p1 TRINITY_DN34563_c0_g1~~TRINITY_DN34563_c0_g1_i2.p1  ORF type:complete len:266 (-),score=44.25 TRINITY_DN34563_c0_g1_i2:10-807(-)